MIHFRKMNLRYYWIYFCFSIIWILTLAPIWAQENKPFEIQKMSEQGIYLRQNWTYLPENLKETVSTLPNFKHSDWRPVNPQLWLDSLSPDIFRTGGWFRLDFLIDDKLKNKPFALLIDQRGASEVYLDGKLIQRLGKVAINPKLEVKFSPRWLPISIALNENKTHTLLLKYSNSNAWKLRKWLGRYARTAGFKLKLAYADSAIKNYDQEARFQNAWNIGLFAVLITIGILHFFIFFFDSKKRADGYYSLAALCMSITFLVKFFVAQETHPEWIIALNVIDFIISNLQVLFLLRFLFQLFNYPKPPYFNGLFILYLANISVFFINHYIVSALGSIYFLIFIFGTIRVIGRAVKDKKEGAKLIGFGVFVNYLLLLIFSGQTFGFLNLWQYLPQKIAFLSNYIGILSTVTAVSLYLAKNFAMTNLELGNQLKNVQKLSRKNLEQERITRQIIENQKEELERQVKKRTSEIQEKNAELYQQNEEIAAQRDAIDRSKNRLNSAYTQITDSVRYAQRIQRAVLGSREEITAQFREGFIFFRPKDIVSGDFYWYAEVETPLKKRKILVVADCTGHGVPGAFMTVMGANFLDEIINAQQITDAPEILQELDQRVTRATHRQNAEREGIAVNDGMDITILVLDETDQKVHFAGAKNSVYFVRNGKMRTFKTSSYAIGGERCTCAKIFSKQTLDIQTGDIFYMASDGFQDQFGGRKDKKYMKKRFREFLLQISSLSMKNQKLKLRQELQAWQGYQSQTDDILVLGIKI